MEAFYGLVTLLPCVSNLRGHNRDVDGGRSRATGALDRAADRLGGQNSPLSLALLLLACAAPFFFSLQLTHDAAWQMWIGRQLLHGANLYSDIIEINPPLWFWIAAPLAAIAAWTGITGLHVLTVFFVASIAASLLLLNCLLPDWPPLRRILFLVAFTIMALPPGNFGQREHFTFIAAAPYVLLIGRRAFRSPISPQLATIVGCFAAVGFALKPQFAVIPIILELWLRRSLIRPETVALACLAVVYSIATFAFEPDFFTESLPLARRAYGQFGTVNPWMIWLTAAALLGGFVVRFPRDACTALLIAALGFYLVFLSQMKGFAYQVMPSMDFLVLALAASATDRRLSAANAARIAATVLAITPNFLPYHARTWVSLPAGSSYASLSVQPRTGWPLTEEQGLKWSLRSMSLWMAPAVGDSIRADVTHDLRCNPPTYLLVDDRQINFSRMFRDIISNYAALERRGAITIMKMTHSLPSATHCRTVY